MCNRHLINNAFFRISHVIRSLISSQIPMENQRGIKVLNVSYNQIVDVPRKTFPKLYELHTIDMSYNNLTTIGNSVFTTLFSLRHLIFHHNHLEEIRSTTFGKLPTLLKMDLSYNELTKVARGTFAGMSAIRELELHHNQLTDIPSPPISLSHINLAYNNITTIKGRWPTMNSLLSLDLDYNQVMTTIFLPRSALIGFLFSRLAILWTAASSTISTLCKH